MGGIEVGKTTVAPLGASVVVVPAGGAAGHRGSIPFTVVHALNIGGCHGP